MKSTKATATTLFSSIALLQISVRCTSNSSVECPSHDVDTMIFRYFVRKNAP